MRLLRTERALAPADKATIGICIAHRCEEHREVPPLNMAEGNGSSECGVCTAEAFGGKLAEVALEKYDQLVLWPLLDGYADRLTHHAALMDMLREVRTRLMLAGLEYRDVDEVLLGNV